MQPYFTNNISYKLILVFIFCHTMGPMEQALKFEKFWSFFFFSFFGLEIACKVLKSENHQKKCFALIKKIDLRTWKNIQVKKKKISFFCLEIAWNM